MALIDVLSGPVVRPVIAGLLDIKDAPIRGWTASGAFVPTETGDDDLDGNTFLEIDSAIDISEITQDRGIGQPVTITFSAGNMDQEAVVDELVKDRRNFLGRKAKLWLFFLNADEDSVLPEFTVLFSGVMVAAETQRQVGRPAVISVTCDQDLQHAETAPVRWIDHMLFYPDDTWSSFLTDLSRGPIGTAQSGGSRDTGGQTAGAAGGYPNDWTGFRGWNWNG